MDQPGVVILHFRIAEIFQYILGMKVSGKLLPLPEKILTGIVFAPESIGGYLR